MSTNATSPNASAPAADRDLAGVVQAITAAVPGVVQSVMVVVDVLDGNVSGVVLDADEPGGGYVAEQELAQGVTYVLLGVGKLGVGKLAPGISVVTSWLPSDAKG